MKGSKRNVNTINNGLWELNPTDHFFTLIGGDLMITLEEAKQYLRVDFPDDDDLISGLISTAQTLCMDVARMEDADIFAASGDNARTAVMYTVAYLYEHREEADHHALILTLRALLSGMRKEAF